MPLHVICETKVWLTAAGKKADNVKGINQEKEQLQLCCLIQKSAITDGKTIESYTCPHAAMYK